MIIYVFEKPYSVIYYMSGEDRVIFVGIRNKDYMIKAPVISVYYDRFDRLFAYLDTYVEYDLFGDVVYKFAVGESEEFCKAAVDKGFSCININYFVPP
ncbi:MAG: hypothetical protein JZD41_02295 [Thermoproteus sp.]|nr:hypothetical protein [Thermoproteus sp.]